jgi:hypothetical protein
MELLYYIVRKALHSPMLGEKPRFLSICGAIYPSANHCALSLYFWALFVE